MRPFTDVFREIRKGRAVDQATQLLAEVVAAVDATGKPGSVTVEMVVRPEKGGGNQKTIAVKIKAKRPEHDVPESVFFSDVDGNLHRSDPDQAEMFGDASERAVSGGRRPNA